MTATRFYFDNGATAGAISPTPNAGWDITSGVVNRRLLLLSELGTPSSGSDAGTAETSATVVNRLKRQHVSASQVAAAHTISGTFTLVMRALESSASADDFQQVIISVWDSTGSTQRGVLYAGQTTSSVSSTPGDPNEEIPTGTSATRIMNAISVTPVAAQVGDRIVVEYGFRATNTVTTSFTVTNFFNASSSSSDFALTSGLTTGLRPWIEFSDDIFAAAPLVGTAASTVTISTSSAARLGRSGGTAKPVTIAATSAARLGLVGGSTKTVTAATVSAGLRATFGTAARTVTATATSAGIRGKLGGAARTVTIAATSAARLGAVAGTTKTITVTTSSGGIVAGNTPGTAAKTITVSSVSAARLGRSGGAAKALTITPTAAGVRGKVATAAKSLTIATTATGTRATTTGATSVIAVTTTAGGTVTKTGSTITYWDGDTAQTATLLGYWDGSTVQPATTLGYWDGAATHPLA